MTIVITSPITGAAQTGLTSPTYTIVADNAPASYGKQWAVTALGGTQTGVLAHSVAAPFTIAAFRPQTFKSLSPVNSATGQLRGVPINTYKVNTRKGVLPLAGQPYKEASISSAINVPAGSDIADNLSLRAMISAHIGTLQQISAGLGDTVVNGVLG
jgi:hypothetical protein